PIEGQAQGRNNPRRRQRPSNNFWASRGQFYFGDKPSKGVTFQSALTITDGEADGKVVESVAVEEKTRSSKQNPYLEGKR
ncbi:hypothetical protein, partial [Methylocaldum szegediense]|uniref:hypothetical protein n=1 Tax=Methylocaldum szegediense TaxID=73780 RepID=UPI00047AF529